MFGNMAELASAVTGMPAKQQPKAPPSGLAAALQNRGGVRRNPAAKQPAKAVVRRKPDQAVASVSLGDWGFSWSSAASTATQAAEQFRQSVSSVDLGAAHSSLKQKMESGLASVPSLARLPGLSEVAEYVAPTTEAKAAPKAAKARRTKKVPVPSYTALMQSLAVSEADVHRNTLECFPVPQGTCVACVELIVREGPSLASEEVARVPLGAIIEVGTEIQTVLGSDKKKRPVPRAPVTFPVKGWITITGVMCKGTHFTHFKTGLLVREGAQIESPEIVRLEPGAEVTLGPIRTVVRHKATGQFVPRANIVHPVVGWISILQVTPKDMVKPKEGDVAESNPEGDKAVEASESAGAQDVVQEHAPSAGQPELEVPAVDLRVQSKPSPAVFSPPRRASAPSADAPLPELREDAGEKPAPCTPQRAPSPSGSDSAPETTPAREHRSKPLSPKTACQEASPVSEAQAQPEAGTSPASPTPKPCVGTPEPLPPLDDGPEGHGTPAGPPSPSPSAPDPQPLSPTMSFCDDLESLASASAAGDDVAVMELVADTLVDGENVGEAEPLEAAPPPKPLSKVAMLRKAFTSQEFSASVEQPATMVARAEPRVPKPVSSVKNMSAMFEAKTSKTMVMSSSRKISVLDAQALLSKGMLPPEEIRRVRKELESVG
mmetsp:Transcript_19209/g.48774  ORF Transcript_19209/g.48774 Transcript_19209/m.48774 type:complete len:661 (+) Transcript_19209:36-2018(+)